MIASASNPREIPLRALIVDDDSTSLTTLEHLLRAIGWQVQRESDPREALARFQGATQSGTRYDVLLTDYLMPGLSGLELIEEIHLVEPTLATILITGDSERKTLSDSIKAGVSGFLEKPVRPPALREALEKARLQTLDRRRVAADQERLREISAIHQTLAPDQEAEILSGLHCQLLSRSYPVYHAGGDFLSVTKRNNGTIQLVLGDVSGHGLKEGFIAAFFQGMVKGMQAAGALPGQIAATCNRFLLDDWQQGQKDALPSSLGALFVGIDLAGRRLSVLNCGCPGVGFFQPGESARTLAPYGSPLGWFEDLAAGSETVNLPRLGCILISSDGLVDLAAHLRIQPTALACRCLLSPPHADLDLDDPPAYPDDLMVACLRWSDLEESNQFLPVFRTTYSGEETSSIDAIHNSLARNLTFALRGLHGEKIDAIALCAREALINGWEHGCAKDPHLSTEIIVDLHLEPPVPLIRLAVQDPGQGFDYQAPPQGPPKDPSDPDHIPLGIAILRNLAEKVHHTRRGTRLEMEFPLPSLSAINTNTSSILP